MKHSTFGYLLILFFVVSITWAVLHFEQFIALARAVNVLLR